MNDPVKVHARTINKSKGIGVIIRTEKAYHGSPVFVAHHRDENNFLVVSYSRNRELAIKRLLRKLGYNG